MGVKSSWNKVLYQKLGKQWYLFTEVDGEIKYSILPPGVHPHHQKREIFAITKERPQHKKGERSLRPALVGSL